MNIGKTIANLRKEKGMSQVEFAEKVGIAQTSLSQIESGKKRPNPLNLKSIGDELKISELHLYFLSFDESDVPEEKRELYRSLEKPLRQLVQELLPNH